VRLAEVPQDTVPVRVALVQQHIPQAERWAASPEQVMAYYERYAELTKLYAEVRPPQTTSSVDLVVWPESALLPYYSQGHEEFFDPLLKTGDFSLLAGTDTLEPAGDSYVSAVLLRDRWSAGKLYHKRHLVPYGEYLPLRWVPGMELLLGGVLPGDFQEGPEVGPLPLMNVPGVELLPLVCFEDTVARVARAGIREAPQLLVNLTNDGWFLRSAEPEIHMQNARLRCVELRRPMVRACNTGVTAMISAKGEVTAALRDVETGSPFIQGVLPGTVLLEKAGRVTFYAQWGDAFAALALGFALICGLGRMGARSGHRVC
jgi:apolipoprotein N-acyltransferase